MCTTSKNDSAENNVQIRIECEKILQFIKLGLVYLS